MTNIGAKQANYHSLIRISFAEIFIDSINLMHFMKRIVMLLLLVCDGLYSVGAGKKRRTIGERIVRMLIMPIVFAVFWTRCRIFTLVQRQLFRRRDDSRT